MHSCIYTGKVRHRRLEPAHHEFTYRIYLMMLDLDEIHQVFAKRLLWSTSFPNFAWFREKDHLRSLREQNKSESLKDLLRSYLKSHSIENTGPIRLLTQLRYLGFAMNPVSFYYCYGSDGKTLQAIVAQVNNTPWGEEHLYLIKGSTSKSKLHSVKNLNKDFHVSPFMPMEMYYNMHFSEPHSKLAVRMTNFHKSNDNKVHDVVMTLNRKPLSMVNLMSVLVTYPMISCQIFAGIYWQALKIYLKKIPFFPHPRKRKTTNPIEQPLAKATD